MFFFATGSPSSFGCHETLPHHLYLPEIYNANSKNLGLSPKKLLAKNMQNQGNFTQLPTLIVNISGTSRYIQNRKDLIKNDSSCIWQKKSGELLSTNYKVGHASLDPPKLRFGETYFSL